jgi:hypothetical protein
MKIEIHRILLGITSCYLIRHAGVILIDAGDANRGEKFKRSMDRLGIRECCHTPCGLRPVDRGQGSDATGCDHLGAYHGRRGKWA